MVRYAIGSMRSLIEDARSVSASTQHCLGRPPSSTEVVPGIFQKAGRTATLADSEYLILRLTSNYLVAPLAKCVILRKRYH